MTHTKHNLQTNTNYASALCVNREKSRFVHIAVIVIMALAVIAMSGMLTYTANAASTPSPSATCRVDSSDGIILRKSASTSSSKVKGLADNTKLKIYKEVFTSSTKYSSKYRWYYVSVSGVKGYVRSDLVDSIEYSPVKSLITGTQTYRVGAGTSMPSKGAYSKGDKPSLQLEVKAKGSDKKWYKVKKNSRYYYIASTNVKVTSTTTPSQPTTPTTPPAATTKVQPYAYCRVDSSDGVFLRKKASTSSDKVKNLADNTKLTVKKVVFTSKTKYALKYRWYYVKVSGVYGYIRGDLVDSFTYAYVKARFTGTQKYRLGAGTEMPSKGEYHEGASAYLLLVAQAKDSSKTWYKVKKDGKYYYIADTHVKITSKSVTDPTKSTETEPAKPVEKEVAVSDAQAEKRINQLYNALNKKYFTTDGKPSGSSVDPRCGVEKVILKNQDVLALVKKYKGSGTMNPNYLPGHYSASYNNPSGSVTYMLKGWSCCGFANFAEWYISADKVDEDVTCKPEPVAKNIKYNYSTVKKAVNNGKLKIGDVCRTNGYGSYGSHSFIFIELRESGCLVLDANCYLSPEDKPGQCRVYRHVIPWGDYVMTASRSNKRK